MFCTRDDRSRHAASCDRTHQPGQARSTAVVHALAWGSHFPLAHVRAPAPRSRLCGTPRGEFLSESANPSFESIMSRNLCCSVGCLIAYCFSPPRKVRLGQLDLQRTVCWAL